MDHDVVVREKMTERYLLNELGPDDRERFEEHYFDCAECAVDVRAAHELVLHSKVVLGESTVPAAGRVTSPASNPVTRGWFGWLRPGWAAPAMALLLIVVGYQNLILYPRLKRPQVMPWASLNVGTYGSERQAITAAPGQGFMLFVRIPPDGAYASYVADLYDPAGKLEWSLPIPGVAGQDQWPVQVPGAGRQAGTYTLAVRGVTAAGASKEVGRTSFELQIQK